MEFCEGIVRELVPLWVAASEGRSAWRWELRKVRSVVEGPEERSRSHAISEPETKRWPPEARKVAMRDCSVVLKVSSAVLSWPQAQMTMG